jgi:hypothetical protein
MTELSTAGHNVRSASVHLRVAHLAKRQHGPFRRDQVVALGLAEDAIDKRIARKQYDVVHQRVYKLAGVDLSRLGEASAAVLAAEPDAFISHRTAARFRGANDRYDGPIEVSVTRHPPPQLEGVEVHEARLLSWERGSYRGVPCVTLPRLMLQLATLEDMKQLTRSYEKAKRQGLTIKQLERVIAEHKGERGIANLRKLVERHRDDRGGSRGGYEDAFYAWLRREILPKGFPLPERNAPVAARSSSSTGSATTGAPRRPSTLKQRATCAVSAGRSRSSPATSSTTTAPASPAMSARSSDSASRRHVPERYARHLLGVARIDLLPHPARELG